MGTHPTREKITLPLSEAVKRISDKDMTEMCLTVNRTFGSAMANKLLDLIGAARREARERGEG